MLATLVIADGKRSRGFSGVYEMIARGNCLKSDMDFIEDPDGDGYIPKEGALVWGGIDMAYATWVFNVNGTGEANGHNFAFDLPPGPSKARDNIVKFKFTYIIKHDGAIYVDITEPGYLQPMKMEGMVSKDRKIITLHSEYVRFGKKTIFMASRVLIRVKKEAEEDDD
jgi:hypothetical protein